MICLIDYWPSSFLEQNDPLTVSHGKYVFASFPRSLCVTLNSCCMILALGICRDVSFWRKRNSVFVFVLFFICLCSAQLEYNFICKYFINFKGGVESRIWVKPGRNPRRVWELVSELLSWQVGRLTEWRKWRRGHEWKGRGERIVHQYYLLVTRVGKMVKK